MNIPSDSLSPMAATQRSFSSRAVRIATTGFKFNLHLIGQFGYPSGSNALKDRIKAIRGQFHTFTLARFITLNAWSYEETGGLTKTGRPQRRKVARCPIERSILKVSRCQIRVGISYEEMQVTKEKREKNILPVPPEGKEWAEFPHFMVSLRTGQLLLAGSPVKGSKRITAYFNSEGDPIDKREYLDFWPKGESTPDTVWLTPEFRSIIDFT